MDAHPGAVAEYKLAQLLLLYSLTIAKVIGTTANLSTVLDRY